MQTTDLNDLPNGAYLRLAQVLTFIPISRSAWYSGIHAGKYPRPVKLGIRTSVYRLADIKKLLEDLGR
jgi:predicted DNA-binding transcriptional regulator AlpA